VSQEIEYLAGPRYIDGVNLDIDIVAAHPEIKVRDVADPVNDGSLGTPSYVQSATNKDGSMF